LLFLGPVARGRAHTYADAAGRVRQTVAMVNRRPQLELPIGVQRDRRSASAAAASPAEAAAIVAALERFMRDTAPTPAPPALGPEPWTRAAMLERVGREDEWPSAWGDPHPWS
jgi:hypothetical protein